MGAIIQNKKKQQHQQTEIAYKLDEKMCLTQLKCFFFGLTQGGKHMLIRILMKLFLLHSMIFFVFNLMV